MSSSASPFSLIPLSVSRPYCTTILHTSPHPILFSHSRLLVLNRRPYLSVSAAESHLHVSWAPPDPTWTDDYGGWAIVEAPIQKAKKKQKKGLPIFLLVGIGTSIVTLLAVIAQSSLYGRGLSTIISSPLHALHGILRPLRTEKSDEFETSANYELFNDANDHEAFLESVSDKVVETMPVEKKYSDKQGKLGRILVPTALDSTQQEALSIMRRLKIIEEDIKADDLCTRREYARWLIRANTLLERNPKYRILPSASVLASKLAAFDDIHVEDPDFEAIQSLAEAGIVRSRLAGKNFGYLDDTKEGGIFFFPERFLSRQDLIDWKAQLEYEVVLGMNEKILGSNLGFMDVKEISEDASPELFVDMLAGDKSIIRRVFGQGKRFQPNKPCTKTQAAVALTSGRMAEAVKAEITRQNAENLFRKQEMEVIKIQLLEKGDIKNFWDEKLEEEKTRASEVERNYLAAIHNLEQENISQEKAQADYMKQRAALDCQRQLLLSLEKEIHEMSKRLTVEKVEYEDERRILKDMLGDSQGKLEKASDAKSVLEAEIESLRILRSWIEDEAKKSQSFVKVLEEVGRRWKWDDRT